MSETEERRKVMARSWIGNILHFWDKADRKYNKLKADEESRETSVSLGIRGIIQAILSAAFVVLFVFGGVFCATKIEFELAGLLFLLGTVIAFLCGLAVLVQGFFGALFYVIYQLKLNKRAIGWIALIIWFLCLGGAIAGSVVLIGII